VSHVIGGLIALVLGIFGIISWWYDFGLVLRGLVPLLLVVGGLIAIGSGLSKASSRAPEGESEEAE
jgi:hypothetical protein